MRTSCICLRSLLPNGARCVSVSVYREEVLQRFSLRAENVYGSVMFPRVNQVQNKDKRKECLDES